jgi:hypothetical protein
MFHRAALQAREAAKSAIEQQLAALEQQLKDSSFLVRQHKHQQQQQHCAGVPYHQVQMRNLWLSTWQPVVACQRIHGHSAAVQGLGLASTACESGSDVSSHDSHDSSQQQWTCPSPE